MQVLRFNSPDAAESTVVLLFGLGLIGTAISKALQLFGFGLQRTITLDWQDHLSQSRAFEVIRTDCLAGEPVPGRLAVVWSAGESGFHSAIHQTVLELENFSQVVESVRQLVEDLSPNGFEFHLLSSAGGLFEGQRGITLDSKPEPLRPYGELKYAQEQALSEVFERTSLAFHRPSSVYGPMAVNSRKGLINNLIRNGYANRTTVLDAHVMALRDYVFSQDVGRYVARLIRTKAVSRANGPEHFLVSAKCSSIYEIVRRVERGLKLRLRIRFDQDFGNSQNITFSDSVLPGTWKPVSLDIGLRQFLLHDEMPRQAGSGF